MDGVEKTKPARKITKVEDDFSLAAYRTPHVYSVDFTQELIKTFDLRAHESFFLDDCDGCFDVYLAHLLQSFYLSYTGAEFNRPRTPNNNQSRELYKNISLHASELQGLLVKLHLNQRLEVGRAEALQDVSLATLEGQLSRLANVTYGLELQVPEQRGGRKEAMNGVNDLITELYFLYRNSTQHHSGGGTANFIKTCLMPIELPSTIRVRVDGLVKEGMKLASKKYKQQKGE